jgi:glycosyltransferase involved in cell wall biosynthesis
MGLSISVVICCFNSAKRIKPTLEHLSFQKFRNNINPVWEIILVDNASTDNTANISKSIWDELGNDIPLIIVDEMMPGKSNALIKGYNMANFDLILLCDDDNWLNENYLQRVIDLFNLYPNIGLLGGYGSTAWFGENVHQPEWFCEYQNSYVVGNHIGESGFLDCGYYNIWGAGSVIKKKVWDWLYSNGFHYKNSVTPGRAQTEDTELSYVLSLTDYKLYFDNKLTFIHDLSGGRITFDNLVNQVKLNGKNLSWISYYMVIQKQVKYNKPTYFIYFYFLQLKKMLNFFFVSSIRIVFNPNKNQKNKIYLNYLSGNLTLLYFLLNFKKYLKQKDNDYRFIKSIYKKNI